MRRHIIYGQFGSKDIISVPKTHFETQTSLKLLNPKGKLNYGVQKLINDLARIGLSPSETSIDLLILALHIQAADTRISRTEDSQDTWTREIRLIVPVSNIKKWNAISSILKKTLDFLTGDLWNIQFRSRSTNFCSIIKKNKKFPSRAKFDSVSLLSGGVDSLIGTINLLEKGHIPLLISHASEGIVSKAQKTIVEQLKKQYSQINFNHVGAWIKFPNSLIGSSKPETTTRGRSFLFFSLGVLAGSCLNNKFTLLVPENGFISLNVPLDKLRLGSLSTHTTHPFYMARWNQILKILEIPAKIENPYWNKTKGEMILECSNRSFLRKIISSSLSCSSPTKGRWKGHIIPHCGYCAPCLIRQSAFKKGFNSELDNTQYAITLNKKKINTLRAEGKQIRSFQLAIRRLKLNPSCADILINSSGPLFDVSSTNHKELSKMHKRGMKEVESLLKNVKVGPLTK